MGRNLSESVERKLYAESMGRCMNPNCKEELFKMNGDIIERAHIIPYAKTSDNSLTRNRKILELLQFFYNLNKKMKSNVFIKNNYIAFFLSCWQWA